jgi:hypothetical protein
VVQEHPERDPSRSSPTGTPSTAQRTAASATTSRSRTTSRWSAASPTTRSPSWWGLVGRHAQPEPTILESVRGPKARHILFIAAGSQPDEVPSNALDYQAAPARSTLWIIPKAGHTAGSARDPAAYQTQVLRFFDEALVERRRSALVTACRREAVITG